MTNQSSPLYVNQAALESPTYTKAGNDKVKIIKALSLNVFFFNKSSQPNPPLMLTVASFTVNITDEVFLPTGWWRRATTVSEMQQMLSNRSWRPSR